MQNPEQEKLRREFGSQVRERREAKKFSQEGLAKKSHVDRQTIYRIEAGATGTRRDTVIRIAMALDWDVDEALINAGQALPVNSGEGFFRGLDKLSPENQQAVKRAMQAMIDSLSVAEETDDDFDYIDDDAPDNEPRVR